MNHEHQEDQPPEPSTEYKPSWRDDSGAFAFLSAPRLFVSGVAFFVGAAVFFLAAGHMCDRGIKWLEAIAPLLGGVLCAAVVFLRWSFPVRFLLILAILSLAPLYLWIIHR